MPAGEQIIVVVFPVTPAGHGWYVQWPPAISQADGWLESPAYIGSTTAPSHNGDTLQIEAILVRDDATYNGTPLQGISVSEQPIADISQVTGMVAQSNPVSLTVRKP